MIQYRVRRIRELSERITDFVIARAFLNHAHKLQAKMHCTCVRHQPVDGVAIIIPAFPDEMRMS